MSKSAIRTLESGQRYLFRDWPNSEVPSICAGVYTIWKDDELIYVGMSGRSLTEDAIKTRRSSGGGHLGLFKRLRSHSRGRRSGDQFCVYVADFLVLPELSREDIASVIGRRRKFDTLVREYIHKHLSYRFVEAVDGVAAFHLERMIREGALKSGKPKLNPA